MKLFSFCTSLLLAGALLFLTAAKPITGIKHHKSPSWYPAITVKNNTDYSIDVYLSYGINTSGALTHRFIDAHSSYTFPNRGIYLLYSVKAGEDHLSPSGFISYRYNNWKKGVGCGPGCSNFTVNMTKGLEGQVTIITSTVTQD